MGRTQTLAIRAAKPPAWSFPRPPECFRRRPPLSTREAKMHSQKTMSPIRAFLFSFSAGLALLFSGQALIDTITPDPPAGTITV